MSFINRTVVSNSSNTLEPIRQLESFLLEKAKDNSKNNAINDHTQEHSENWYRKLTFLPG
ncbi:MAG TPA: hypothetical protein VMZ30_14780 [Pyrinomonadaceae bacterium]|nr:hypothetical protein [Pyrinomonadaceae bacterium]